MSKTQNPKPKTKDQKTGAEDGPARMDEAMRLLIDSKNSCAKCHQIGDYRPGGKEVTILAPNLDQVCKRLQPGYLRRWLADPQSVLPYSPMPRNFPSHGEPKNQDLLPGGGLEQLDAVEQLLLEYDEYAKGKMSIRKQMPQKPIDGL